MDSSPIATISAAHRSGEQSLVRGKRTARPDVPERSNQRPRKKKRSERRISAQASGAKIEIRTPERRPSHGTRRRDILAPRLARAPRGDSSSPGDISRAAYLAGLYPLAGRAEAVRSGMSEGSQSQAAQSTPARELKQPGARS